MAREWPLIGQRLSRRELADRFGPGVKKAAAHSDATSVHSDHVVVTEPRGRRVGPALGPLGRLLVVAAAAAATIALARQPSSGSLAVWTVAGDPPPSLLLPPTAPAEPSGTFSWHLDAPPSVAESSSHGTAAQEVAIPIGRGRLSATPQRQTVVLRPSRTGARAVGSLIPVTVIDARGSLEGWKATIRLSAVSSRGRVRFTPGLPRAVTGNPAEAAPGLPGALTTAAPVVIAYAGRGGGGGTFVVDGQITLDRGADASTGDVTVDVLVTVQ